MNVNGSTIMKDSGNKGQNTEEEDWKQKPRVNPLGPRSPASTVHCQIADRPRSTARHVATTNTAIVVVVNDILGRLTVTFSAFSALSSRVFCSKIEHV